MVSPSKLVETISRVTGVPLPTVVDIDRKLVKGNLRSKRGRGLNAARMTAIDAACLLTAILASPQANAAAHAVMRYTNTCVDAERSSARLYQSARFDELTALPAHHGFVDALAALIASVSKDALIAGVAGERALPHIEVFAFTRATRGRLRVMGLPEGQTSSVEYKPNLDQDMGEERTDRHFGAMADGDLEQSRRITERTIYSVARLWSEERAHGTG